MREMKRKKKKRLIYILMTSLAMYLKKTGQVERALETEFFDM